MNIVVASKFSILGGLSPSGSVIWPASGASAPSFCHPGHQLAHRPHIHALRMLYARQYRAISPSVLNILRSRKKPSPIVRLMVPNGYSERHLRLSIFLSSMWSLNRATVLFSVTNFDCGALSPRLSSSFLPPTFLIRQSFEKSASLTWTWCTLACSACKPACCST